MKKILVLAVSLSAILAAEQPAAPQYVKPVSPDPHDIQRYNFAVTDARRKFFAASMSSLTPEQLRSFWTVYADYEKEKDTIAMAGTGLAKEYLDAYRSEEGPQAAELTRIVNDAGALQKRHTDLRLKYFGIYSQRLDAKAAARFALIDDYITTSIRLNLLTNSRCRPT